MTHIVFGDRNVSERTVPSDTMSIEQGSRRQKEEDQKIIAELEAKIARLEAMLAEAGGYAH